MTEWISVHAEPEHDLPVAMIDINGEVHAGRYAVCFDGKEIVGWLNLPAVSNAFILRHSERKVAK